MKEKHIKKRMQIAWVVLAMVLISIIILPTESKAQNIDPKFQSVFIYGISRQVEWSGKQTNFRIAVVGEKQFTCKRASEVGWCKEN